MKNWSYQSPPKLHAIHVVGNRARAEYVMRHMNSHTASRYIVQFSQPNVRVTLRKMSVCTKHIETLFNRQSKVCTALRHTIVLVLILVPWLLNWTNQITKLEVDKSNINLIR